MLILATFLFLFDKKLIIQKDGKDYEIDVEEYIPGVLEGEISENWPDEVIKAQAVVSRSYALYIHQNERKKLKSDTRDQVWKKSTNSKRITELSRETAGWVLTFQDGSIAPGFFHSTCGGRTENAWEMWGGDTRFKEIISVKCSKCYDSPLFFWKRKININLLKKLAKRFEDPIYGKIIEISSKSGEIYVEKSSAGRILKFFFTDIMYVLYYKDIRDILPSNFFEFEISDEEIEFYGRGWGHGVGLCQWGAKKLAEEGFSWQEILKFYFPKLKIRKIY